MLCKQRYYLYFNGQSKASKDHKMPALELLRLYKENYSKQ